MSIHLPILLATLFSVFTTSTLADKVSPHYQEQTLREKCRLEVAGSYIAAYDRKNHSQEYLQLITQKGKDLSSAIERATKDVKKRKAKEDEAEYDIDEQRSIKTAEQNLENLQRLLQENAELIATARQTAEAAAKIEAALHRQIEKIFDIETVKSDPKGKFPFGLTYKEKCPKYKQECILSKAAAFDLAAMTKGKSEVESCQKYSAQSGI